MTQQCPVIIGIVNVTDDSFSDGGQFVDSITAINHGLKLVNQGATIIDVGGQSTRPGFTAIDPKLEASRVIPVIRELCARKITVSIDTVHASVARKAIDAGATFVNDVSGGYADPAMISLIKETNAHWILMHWPHNSLHTRNHRIGNYHDVVHEVRTQLHRTIEHAVNTGIDPSRLIVDPGIGFGKSPSHNWALLRGIETFINDGFPVMIGVSRKRFLGTLLATDTGQIRQPDQRDTATAVISALAVLHGVWGVRVHDVQASADALKVVHAWKNAGEYS